MLVTGGISRKNDISNIQPALVEGFGEGGQTFT